MLKYLVPAIHIVGVLVVWILAAMVIISLKSYVTRIEKSDL